MRIFVLSSRFPYPLEKGDKLRLYHQLRELSQRHELILCALSHVSVSDAEIQVLQAFCKAVYILPLHKFGIVSKILDILITKLPIQVAYFTRKRLIRCVHRYIELERPDIVFCQLVRMAEYVKEVRIPKLIDYMDAFSLGMERRAAVTRGPVKYLIAWESRLLRKYEEKVFAYFQAHSIISIQDRSALSFPSKQSIDLLPNGVDTDYFSPIKDKKPVYDLAFIGNLGYFPNVEAARRLIHDMLPGIWDKYPDTKVLLAGARPDAEIRRLCSDERIHLSGWVDDIREAYASAKIFVAPIFTGSGQQNKILEAMAMGLPVVTTTLVNQSIHAKDGEDIMVADTVEGLITNILDLLADTALQTSLSQRGRAFVVGNYSWAVSVAGLEKSMEHALLNFTKKETDG